MNTQYAGQTVTIDPPLDLRRPPKPPELMVDPLKSERVELKLWSAPTWRIFGGGSTVQKVKSATPALRGTPRVHQACIRARSRCTRRSCCARAR